MRGFGRRNVVFFCGFPDPEVKLNWSLMPEVPALSVRTTTLPLDVCVPSPVVNDTAPPLKLCPFPAVTEKYPPIAPVVELANPEVTSITPPTLLCAVVSPAETIMSPPLYVLPDPMDNNISPPLPFVAAPVNKLK